MQRRTLLAGIGSTVTVSAIAGCLGDGDDPDDGAGGEGGSASPTIETVAQTEVEDSSDGDRNVESSATVSVEGDAIEIEGQLEGPTPCHDAVVADVTVEDGTVTVYVELEEDDDGMCVQQIAEIEYEATVVVEGDEPERVVVIHTDRVGEATAADVEL